jgi:hypothetical protein
MSSIANRSLNAVLLFALLVTAACAGQPKIVEPIFQMDVTRNIGQLQVAPPDLLSRCPLLTNERWSRRLYIFASADNAESGTTYLVVGGQFIDPESGAMVEIDPNGALIALDVKHCRVYGPVREVFDYGVDGVPKSVLAALAADSVRRYEQMFGGAVPLRAAFRSDGITQSTVRSADLLKAFVHVLP